MSTTIKQALEREPMIHELKTHPEPFQAVKDGSKPFEWRKDDRDYRVGDTLWLREWMPEFSGYGKYSRKTIVLPEEYTGQELRRTITYISRNGRGFCVLGLAELSAPREEGMTDAEIETLIGDKPYDVHQRAVARYWLKYCRDHLSGQIAKVEGHGLSRDEAKVLVRNMRQRCIDGQCDHAMSNASKAEGRYTQQETVDAIMKEFDWCMSSDNSPLTQRRDHFVVTLKRVLANFYTQQEVEALEEGLLSAGDVMEALYGSSWREADIPEPHKSHMNEVYERLKSFPAKHGLNTDTHA